VGGEQVGTWTRSTPCTACSYVVGGDQSGKVYSVDELTGNTKWSVDFSPSGLNRANNIQAAVAAQLRADSDASFQSTYAADVIFAASRNTTATNCGSSTTNNKLFAINEATGSVLWTFNDACGAAPAGGTVDYIAGMPYVDYARNRLYVGSGDAGGSQRSLWIIKTVDGEGVLKGQVLTCAACSGLGAIDASPMLGTNGSTLYFGNTAGRLYAFDVNTLTVRWYRDMGAAIKGFVWDNGGGWLYFSTTNTVWRVKDNFNDTGAINSTDNVRSTISWQRTVNGASVPLLLTNAVYVGSSSDFLLHEIALDNSVEKTLTLDGTAVGDVSTDDGTAVYVSTTAGKLYKVQVPLP
jgi:outer membrane protein assembly factor BamB